MFERLITLIGEDNVNKLKKANVLIVGLGGVGSHTAHMLARSGIGKFRWSRRLCFRNIG